MKKQFMVGFILGAIIFSSISAFAATKAIELYYNNIKIAVNGNEIKTDVEPFIYEGRTFVPVRFIAEAFGKEVKFNETTNTVEIVDTVTQSTYGKIGGASVSTIVEQTTEPTPVIKVQQGEYMKDGLPVMDYNNKTYVRPRSISDRHNSLIQFDYNSKEGILSAEDKKGKQLISSIPFLYKDDLSYIEYDYYINTILPLIPTK